MIAIPAPAVIGAVASMEVLVGLVVDEAVPAVDRPLKPIGVNAHLLGERANGGRRRHPVGDG